MERRPYRPLPPREWKTETRSLRVPRRRYALLAGLLIAQSSVAALTIQVAATVVS